MKTWVKTDVVTEPVTSTEAKLFCKISGTQDDTLIASLIKSARMTIENYTGLALAEKTLYTTFDLPGLNNILDLPVQPVKSVASVKIIDIEGNETALTLNTDYYLIDSPWTKIKIGNVWVSDGVLLKVEYTVGYGASGCPALPEALKIAVLKEIATQYERREDITEVAGQVMDNNSRKLADPFRIKLWL